MLLKGGRFSRSALVNAGQYQGELVGTKRELQIDQLQHSHIETYHPYMVKFLSQHM